MYLIARGANGLATWDEAERNLQEIIMCPVCIASAAAMAAGAGSTGGILAVCIGKFRKFFKVVGFGLLQKIKEK